jgi:hypothetical protein
MGLDSNHNLSFGYDIKFSQPRDDVTVTADPNDTLPDLPSQYFRAGLSFGWRYSDLYSSPFAISREKGRSVYANMQIYHPAFGGNQKLSSISGGWKEYWLAPWRNHHVFALNVKGRIYISKPKGQAGMSVGGYSEQNIISSVLNNQPKGQPSLRGYPSHSIYGDHMISLKFEYRFPIWLVERGYATLPLFFKRLHAGIFTDNVIISYKPFETSDIRSSAGLELVWSFTLGYYQLVTLRTGYARGFMEGGINDFFIIMGTAY